MKIPVGERLPKRIQCQLCVTPPPFENALCDPIFDPVAQRERREVGVVVAATKQWSTGVHPGWSRKVAVPLSQQHGVKEERRKDAIL